MARASSPGFEQVRLFAQTDLRLVSGEPSRSQCRAGAAAGAVSPETARRVYLAMLAADELNAAGRSSR